MTMYFVRRMRGSQSG